MRLVASRIRNKRWRSMSTRYGAGGVRKQHGKWFGFWREGGVQKSQILGGANEMTKGEAREAIAEIVKRIKKEQNPKLFGPFVEGPYFDLYTGRWKASTAENNKQRIRTHLVEGFSEREMASIRRDELQELLNTKSKTHSFSVVDHLRFDLRQIFSMAIAEGILRLNPAALLFTPNDAKRPVHSVMTVPEVALCLKTLHGRERLIAKLAILAGMRPGEIFALTWGRLVETAAEVTQRVYRGKIDTPKTHQSVRKAALSDQLAVDVEEYRKAVGRARNLLCSPRSAAQPCARTMCGAETWSRRWTRSGWAG